MEKWENRGRDIRGGTEKSDERSWWEAREGEILNAGRETRAALPEKRWTYIKYGQKKTPKISSNKLSAVLSLTWTAGFFLYRSIVWSKNNQLGVDKIYDIIIIHPEYITLSQRSWATWLSLNGNVILRFVYLYCHNNKLRLTATFPLLGSVAG